MMGHADIHTSMIYAHHVPRHDAAAKLTEYLDRERGAVGTVYQDVYSTDENSAQLSTNARPDQARNSLTSPA